MGKQTETFNSQSVTHDPDEMSPTIARCVPAIGKWYQT